MKKPFINRADAVDALYATADTFQKESPMKRDPDREVAQRDPIRERYDILDPRFLYFMAIIGSYGANKYGDFNWKKSRLTGDKSPINHIYKHLRDYQLQVSYDHDEVGVDHYIHLASIAFNAMMEFYWAFKTFEIEKE